jgi:hypothetical protein
MVKYEPNGVPLTDYERELLTILMEECAEVIQAASKLIRFGKEDRPDDLHLPNSEVLGIEIGDLKCMIDKILIAGIVEAEHLTLGTKRKQARLLQYMQTEPTNAK